MSTKNMAKIPKLPRVKPKDRAEAAGRSQSAAEIFKRRTVSRLKKEHMGDAEPRKFRDPARVEAARQEFLEWTEEQGLEKAALDKKIADSKAAVDAMRADQSARDLKAKALTLDEQLLIIRAHFEHGIGAKIIGQQLGRNHSVITRFLEKYKSTVPLAKMHLENNAQRLAKRVVNEADVDQSLEILDRLDVLPRKDRKNEGGTSNTFQVIVGMPASGPAAVVVPSQMTIEAARVAPKEPK